MLRNVFMAFAALLLVTITAKGYAVLNAFKTTPAQAESKAPDAPAASAAAADKAAPATNSEKPQAAEEAAKETPRDVTEFTPSELELLQSLRERRQQIADRETAITEREKVLSGLESQVEAKINELSTIKDQIEQIRNDIDQRSKKFRKSEDEQILSLVRVYEKMKPKDAAAIFNNLELTILLEIVKNTKEAKLAPIMAAMDPAKAKTLSAELAQREKLPSLPN